MRMWTWQGRTFNITEDEVNLQYSDFYNNNNLPGIKPAYDNLLKILIKPPIWCYVEKNEVPKKQNKCKLWELEVPEDKVIFFVSGCVWNKIIGQKRFAPPKWLQHEWWKEGIQKSPDKLREFIKKKQQDYWKPEPQDLLWERIFSKRFTREYSWALLPCPIEKTWVWS